MVDTYIDGYPKPIYDAIRELQGSTKEAKASDWLSQPRLMVDDTTEIIRYTFGRPASVSSVAMEVRNIGTEYEVWYKNRSGTVQPLLKISLQTMSGVVPASDDIDSYTRLSFESYPVVATELEIRLTRRPDEVSPVVPVSVGLRNVLVKRSILTRQDATVPVPDYVDSIGNTVVNTVTDWGPENAVDGDMVSYWKSEPQPSPDAVVSLFLDVRDDEGNGQWVNHFFLDPVFSDQTFNVYYSSDDTEGLNLLSEKVVVPRAQADTQYVPNLGLRFDSSGLVKFDNEVEPEESFWVGVQWSPEYPSSTSKTGYLFRSGNVDVMFTGREVRLLVGGSIRNTVVLPEWVSGETFNVVAGVNRSRDTVEAGSFLAVVVDGSSDFVVDDRLSSSLRVGSPRAVLNGSSVPLESFFGVEDDFFTALKSRLRDDDVLKLVWDVEPGQDELFSNRRVSFEALSDVKYGAPVSPVGTVRVCDGSGDSLVSLTVPRSAVELCPNPLLEVDGAFLGLVVDVDTPAGNAVTVDKVPSFFDMQRYIDVSYGDSFDFSCIVRELGSLADVVPVLSSGSTDDSGLYRVSNRRFVHDFGGGWQQRSCSFTWLGGDARVRLGVKSVSLESEAVYDDTRAYVTNISFRRSQRSTPATRVFEDPVRAHASFGSSFYPESVEYEYRKAFGNVGVSGVELVSVRAEPSSALGGTVSVEALHGVLKAFVLKREPVSLSAAKSFLQSPEIFVVPEPSVSDDLVPVWTSLSNAVLVGRMFFEEVFRGGTDFSKFVEKRWTPVFEDWFVDRQWYYLPSTTFMKFLKFEFTNLTMQPYRTFEDGTEVKYQVFPVSVVQESVAIANTITTKVDQTTTVDTHVNKTETGDRSSVQNFHDRAVTKNSSLSSQYSYVDMPKTYEIEIKKPTETSIPVASGIKFDSEFRSETANEVLLKTHTRDVDVKTESSTTTNTWTETIGSRTVKWVAADIYYRVVPGDCLIFIAQKLGIPDWRVIYAYNLWLQTDPRVSMLPARSPGWWIFPGQLFRIPGATMKQVVVDTRVTVRRSSKTTTTTKVTTTFDEETLVTQNTVTDTVRDRFRTESVHRYETKTVAVNKREAYFAGLRDVFVAATNWLTERDTLIFDFVDYEFDGFTVNGAYRDDLGVYRPLPGSKASIVSPVFRTVSLFRAVKVLGVNRDSVVRVHDLGVESLRAFPETLDSSDAVNAVWADGEAVWDDSFSTWGSKYGAEFSRPAITVGDGRVTFETLAGSRLAAVVSGSFRGERGVTVSGSVRLMPLLEPSDDCVIQLMVVDGDTGLTLASVSVPESPLVPLVDNLLVFPNFTCDRVYENLVFKVMFFDRGAAVYEFSELRFTTGTMKFLLRNDSEGEWEDVSRAVGQLDGIYSFEGPGRELQVRVEMTDDADWSTGLSVIPVYQSDGSFA